MTIFLEETIEIQFCLIHSESISNTYNHIVALNSSLLPSANSRKAERNAEL